MDSLQVMILGASKYNFKEESTGREVKGVTVHYVQLTHTNEEDKVGYFPTKASFSDQRIFEEFRGVKFPVQADASITFDLANKRNPIKVTGFANVQSILID